MSKPLAAERTAGPLRLEDIPRPPEGALRVLAACADEQADVGRIGKLVAADPVLAADLLRVVNSPYFGLGQDIAAVDHAVALLGLNALRNRIICLTVRAATRATPVPGMDSAAFVEDSLRRAVTARALAAMAPVNPDDAFTAGLLQDFGLLILMVSHRDSAAGQWSALRAALPEARREMEQALFQDTHDAILGALAEAWHLPAMLVGAVAAHHDAGTDDPLAQLLSVADRVNAVFTGAGNLPAVRAAEAELLRRFGLTPGQAHEWLAAIPALVTDAAAGLQMAVPEQVDLDTLSARINTRLADDNLGFQEMNWKLQQALRERDELAARLAGELEIAREIQCSLLPGAPTAAGPVWARNVSARELSGDFYDYFTAADGRVLFNLGDVSGKGLTAALLMAKTCSLFRCLGRRQMPLEDIIAVINEEICDTSVRGMFVTMVAGSYDPVSRKVEIVSAGHPPPMLWRQGQGIAVVAGADSPPLGIVPGIAFETRTVSLADACLYLYSDGVSEAMDADGDELGLRGLATLIAGSARLPPGSRIDSIVDAVAGGDCRRRDDITLAVLDPGALH